MQKNAAKLLKVAWLSVPLGILITCAASMLVFWWQSISYTNPYAQAILINGNALCFNTLLFCSDLFIFHDA